MSTLMQPPGVRLDVAYNRTYRLPMTNSPFSPYIIGGLGGYHASCAGSLECEGSTHFGWNGGLGFNVAALGLRPFLEARYHSTRDLDFIPLTVGQVPAPAPRLVFPPSSVACVMHVTGDV